MSNLKKNVEKERERERFGEREIETVGIRGL